MLRKLKALNIAQAESTGDIYFRETRQRIGGMDNGVDDSIASVSFGSHCPVPHLIALALPAHSCYKKHWDSTKRIESFYGIFTV